MERAVLLGWYDRADVDDGKQDGGGMRWSVHCTAQLPMYDSESGDPQLEYDDEQSEGVGRRHWNTTWLLARGLVGLDTIPSDPPPNTELGLGHGLSEQLDADRKASTPPRPLLTAAEDG